MKNIENKDQCLTSGYKQPGFLPGTLGPWGQLTDRFTLYVHERITAAQQQQLGLRV